MSVAEFQLLLSALSMFAVFLCVHSKPTVYGSICGDDGHHLNRLSRVLTCVCARVTQWMKQMIISDVCLFCRSPRTAATPQSRMKMLKVGFIFLLNSEFSPSWKRQWVELRAVSIT